MHGKRTQPLTDKEIASAASNIRRRGRSATIDVALYYLMLTSGAKPIEIARLRIGDVLEPSGELREVFTLDAGRTISRLARDVYLLSTIASAAIEAYLQFRIDHAHGLGQRGRFRGLDPNTSLFLDQDGQPFPITHSSVGQRHFCRGLTNACKRIYLLSGIPGLSDRLFRRTLAHRLRRRGASKKQIAEVLGISDVASIEDLLNSQPPPIAEAMRDIVPVSDSSHLSCALRVAEAAISLEEQRLCRSGFS